MSASPTLRLLFIILCSRYLKLGTKYNNSLPTHNGRNEGDKTLERLRGGNTMQTDFRTFSTMSIFTLCSATVSRSCCKPCRDGASNPASNKARDDDDDDDGQSGLSV